MLEISYKFLSKYRFGKELPMSLRVLLKTLLCRVIPIGITTVLCGAILFVTTVFFLPDMY